MWKEIPENVKHTGLDQKPCCWCTKENTRWGPETRGLTVVRHAHRETLVKPAVLALVAVLLLDFAVVFALVVLQLEPDGPPEEALVDRPECQNLIPEQETPNCRVTL